MFTSLREAHLIEDLGKIPPLTMRPTLALLPQNVYDMLNQQTMVFYVGS